MTGPDGPATAIGDPASPRGPRPLTLHLATALIASLSAPSASLLWRDGALDLAEPATLDADRRRAIFRRAAPAQVADAIAAAAGKRLRRFVAGLDRYHGAARPPPPPDLPAVWSAGGTRLIDFGVAAAGARPAAVIAPSLINRARILDLRPARSFVHALRASGRRPLLIDWGDPDDVARGFALAGYVARLRAALRAAAVLSGGPVSLIGYCMGGLLALAAALAEPDHVAALVLLATPWDFHAGGVRHELFEAAPLLEAVIDECGALPADLIQALLWTLDPMLVIRKFEEFANLADDVAVADFVRLEDWINDGPPLAAGVARDCLFGWYRDNDPARLVWRIDHEIVDPARFAGPALLVVPESDRIVPPSSALALGQALPGAAILRVPLGHIGMMSSARAPAAVWRPVLEWLDARS